MLVARISKIFRCSTASSHFSALNVAQRWNSKQASGGSYVVEPTTMKIQKFDPSSHNMKDITPIIAKYSTKGFKIQGNKLYGPVAILPKSFFSWKVQSSDDITIKSLQLFTVVEPKIEILVIGTGVKIQQLSNEVRSFMKKHNIALEVLDTPNACSTFNFLLEEGRMSAAALIPPSDIPLY